MEGLAALDHVDKGCRIHEATIRGALGALGCLAALAPEIAVAVIVVIEQADGGAVLDDVSKLDPVLQPAVGVLIVVVGLVPGEEDQVRIERVQVFDQVGTLVDGFIIGGIAGSGGHRNRCLVTGVLAHQAGETGELTQAGAVGGVHGVIPVFHAEVGGPAGILHGLLLDGLPLAPAHDF